MGCFQTEWEEFALWRGGSGGGSGVDPWHSRCGTIGTLLIQQCALLRNLMDA